ncbi:hypothetical protein [Trichlorobacter sp.]|uniref:hypothetical protein n=1 Tax=Trichlorobacter sp. TaxID=2911007 RepID=UPI002A35AA58|nr:hypothetical protein [Trichlorobacter sp.]MDY0384746.1 hypothetical protein [Trichlorobacter sp.]
MTDDLKKLLQKELQLLDDARQILAYSFAKCSKIGLKPDYTPEELESFESLCSRFARLSDIMTQKIFRLLAEIALEQPGTVRDRINRAEKWNLIESAEEFVAIRIVRNDIAHEYLPEAIRDIFKKVMGLTPALLKAVDLTKNYCSRL